MNFGKTPPGQSDSGPPSRPSSATRDALRRAHEPARGASAPAAAAIPAAGTLSAARAASSSSSSSAAAVAKHPPLKMEPAASAAAGATAGAAGPVPLRDQGEEEWALLERAGCVDAAGRYLDPDFPAAAASLFVDPAAPPPGHPPFETVRFLRPHEFARAGAQPASLYGAGRGPLGPLTQGAVGDGWFLSALCAVATRRDLLDVLLPRHAAGAAPGAGAGADRGVYTVRFYKQGRWRNVVVDDRIPCDATGQPLYARQAPPPAGSAAAAAGGEELWAPLVEKAYAKLHGCYEALAGGGAGGSVAAALLDLTGGAVQALNLREAAVAEQVRARTPFCGALPPRT